MSDRTGRLLADLVKYFHLAWAFFVIASLPAVALFPGIRMVVITAAAGMLLTWIVMRDCPIHVLEQRLRARFHREGTYIEGFMHHHFGKRFGFAPRTTLFVTVMYTVLVLGVCILV